MTRRFTVALVLAIALTPGIPAAASTFVVDVAGAGDFLTIGEGVSAAASGDTVLVYPGTYSGSDNAWLDFGGRDIALRSTSGPDETIMELGSGGWKPAFTFESGESRQAIVDGFTISHGIRWFTGGGFVCIGASPTIRNCLFTHCSAEGDMHIEGWGGAGYLHGSQALIEDCSFVLNSAYNSGDALWIGGGSDVTIRNCGFANNDGSFEGDGAVVIYSGGAHIEGCTFFDNGDCAATNWGAAEFCECTFVANGDGAWDDVVRTNTNCEFDRCIFAFNDAESAIDCSASGPTILRCCFYESGAPADCVTVEPAMNLFEDPRFCGLDLGDLSLCADSPCLPGGNDWEVQIGADGEGCGGCGSPVERTSWGSIKALFR